MASLFFAPIRICEERIFDHTPVTTFELGVRGDSSAVMLDADGLVADCDPNPFADQPSED
jgi:hypothetical protein